MFAEHTYTCGLVWVRPNVNYVCLYGSLFHSIKYALNWKQNTYQPLPLTGFEKKNEWIGQILTFYLDFFFKKNYKQTFLMLLSVDVAFSTKVYSTDIEGVTFKKRQRFHKSFFSFFRMVFFWSIRRNFVKKCFFLIFLRLTRQT